MLGFPRPPPPLTTLYRSLARTSIALLGVQVGLGFWVPEIRHWSEGLRFTAWGGRLGLCIIIFVGSVGLSPVFDMKRMGLRGFRVGAHCNSDPESLRCLMMARQRERERENPYAARL